jgi:hypothetical protein
MLSGQLHRMNGLSPMKAPVITNEQEAGLAPYPDAMGKQKPLSPLGFEKERLIDVFNVLMTAHRDISVQ